MSKYSVEIISESSAYNKRWLPLYMMKFIMTLFAWRSKICVRADLLLKECVLRPWCRLCLKKGALTAAKKAIAAEQCTSASSSTKPSPRTLGPTAGDKLLGLHFTLPYVLDFGLLCVHKLSYEPLMRPQWPVETPLVLGLENGRSGFCGEVTFI